MSRGERAGVAALLLLFVAVALWGAWTKSDTYDEPMYIVSGYSYVATGDLSMNREHPPLAKYLIGLPLLALDLVLPERYQIRPGIAMAFLFHQPAATHRTMLFLARLGGIALAVLLGLYVHRWARVAFGPAAALAALALYATNPGMLAHCRVAGNDFAVTVFGFATCYHCWRWLDSGKRPSLGWGALMLGLAIGSKLTALVLAPVLGLIVAIEALRRRRPALLGEGLLALAAAGGVLWLLYGGEARSLADARQHVRFLLPREQAVVFRLGTTPAPDGEPLQPGWLENGLENVFGNDTPIPLLSFIKGIDLQLDHARAGHPTYFWGEVNHEGFWHFYLVSWLIKNPEALTLLLLLGVLAMGKARGSLAHETLLLFYPLLLFVVFSRSHVQLGFKYILPVVPFLCVAAARMLSDRRDWRPLTSRAGRIGGAASLLALSAWCWWWFDQKGEARLTHVLPLLLPLGVAARLVLGEARAAVRAAALLLVIWAAVASLVRMPNALFYFNEWVGGPEFGWYYSVIGDDWGQDTRNLGLWMEENAVEHVYYDYYGTGDPEKWGVNSTPTFARPRTFNPVQGWVAVHVTVLARFPQNYTWLKDAKPVATIGHTILLYHLDDEDRLDALFDVLGPVDPPSVPPPR